MGDLDPFGDADMRARESLEGLKRDVTVRFRSEGSSDPHADQLCTKYLISGIVRQGFRE